MISLVLADDQPTTRTGLRAIFSKTPDIQIVGEAQDGIEAEKLVDQLRPRILLLGLKMPGLHPAEVAMWVRTHCPETVTLVLTAYDRDEYLAEMMDAGAVGYLTKNESAETLISSIRRAAQGEMLFTEEQFTRASGWRAAAGEKWKSLTPREREILKLLMQGSTNATIARSLNITAKTVEHHITNILEKLGLDSAKEAMSWVHKYLSNDQL